MRQELLADGAPDAIVDDAVLILSELLSNACRHARPLSPDSAGEYVRAAWCRDAAGELTISVTDGGGPTRPRASTPSVTARGGRGLAIITSLASDWGIDEYGHGHPGFSGPGSTSTPTSTSGSGPSGGRARRTVAGSRAGTRRRDGADRAGAGARAGGARGGAGRQAGNPFGGGGFGRGAGGAGGASGAPGTGDGAATVPADEHGVTVWAVLTPGERLGGAYAGLDLAELDEPA
ncbi:ATP-binding protein [Streptomyces phytohabitans]|uniref:ATP-binding protein n=1 Tax=Streptomyces phytohabitans TaxID=1150371 RepID=UPI00387E433E